MDALVNSKTADLSDDERQDIILAALGEYIDSRHMIADDTDDDDVRRTVINEANKGQFVLDFERG